MKLSYLLISSLLLASISFTSASHRANLDTTHDIYFDDIRVDNAFYAEDVKTSSVHTTKLGTHETRIVALLTEQIMNPESDFIKLEGILRIDGNINWEAAVRASDLPPGGLNRNFEKTESVEEEQEEEEEEEAEETDGEGNLIEEKPAEGDKGKGSFAQKKKQSWLEVNSLIIGGVKQWAMARHENNLIEPDETNVISFPVTDLGEHKSIMVEATLLLNSKGWTGQGLVGKLDGGIGYIQHFNYADFVDDEDMDEHFETVKVSFVSDHSKEAALIQFVSTHKALDINMAMYSLIDIKIYVR